MNIKEVANHMELLTAKMEFYKDKEVIRFTDEELLEFIELRKEVRQKWDKVSNILIQLGKELMEESK
jgi:hypothetical protein